MKLLPGFVCALLALVAVPLPGAAASDRRAQLRHIVCQNALDPPERALSVTAVMRPRAGTARMALRFELLTQQAGRLREVSGGDLGRWVSPANHTLGSRPGDVWILNKQVVDLAAPAAYRLRVSFRWRGRRGRVLATAVRMSSVCHQRELRPDLLVRQVIVAPTATPGRFAYVVTVANDGATAAGPFSVMFSPGGGLATETRQLSGVAAHTHRTLRFTGPSPCTPGLSPTVTVDPGGQVDDFNRANNADTVPCQASAGS